MPQSPKKESQSPMEEDRKPRPPLKEKSAALVFSWGGLLRKTGKICIKAPLWSGSRAKEMIAQITSLVHGVWVDVDAAGICWALMSGFASSIMV